MLVYQSESVMIFDTETEARTQASPMPLWHNPHAQLYAIAPSPARIPFNGPWEPCNHFERLYGD